MAKSRSKKNPKRSVKVRDLRPSKNPRGGKVAVHDITITKEVDKPTPVLMIHTTSK